jgi:mono/diheme cytochrome c family protein
MKLSTNSRWGNIAMRKTIHLYLALALFTAILLTLVSCGGGAAEEPVEEEGEAEPEPEPVEEEEPEPEMVIEGDLVQGGLLYDKWWAAADGAEEPTEDHVIWATQDTNEREGSTTWRCKECHGWDYQGVDGAYSSGSHMTGFPGVLGAADSPEAAVAALTSGDHDFSSVMGEQDVNDLAIFLTEGLIDDTEFIDYDNKAALGDTANGEELYGEVCAACHGADGWQIPFHDGEEGVGTLAVDNPTETLHKIRFGNPGTDMPSSVGLGWSAQDSVDVLAYTQTLPVDPPASEAAVTGGLLYDKWWVVAEVDEPSDDNPMWARQDTNERSGGDTWRCKECHGWDYQGVDGAYSSGSHMTGFPGVLGTEMSGDDIVSQLTGGIDPEHDFSAMGDDNVAALAAFLSEALIDDTEFIDYDSKEALGDAANGEALYGEVCAACHGDDGWQIPFHDGEEGVGTLANDNPTETLHKIRFGNPGTGMPSSVAIGWSAQDAVDVLTYTQTLPVEAP